MLFCTLTYAMSHFSILSRCIEPFLTWLLSPFGNCSNMMYSLGAKRILQSGSLCGNNIFKCQKQNEFRLFRHGDRKTFSVASATATSERKNKATVHSEQRILGE